MFFRATLINYTKKVGERMYQKFWISGKDPPWTCLIDKDGDGHLWPQRSHLQDLHSISCLPGNSGPVLENNSWCITGIFLFLSTISKKCVCNYRARTGKELPRPLEEIWPCHKVFLQGRRIMAKCILIIAFMQFDLHK